MVLRTMSWVLALGLCGACLGCRGSDDPWDRVAVRGEVTLDGQPLATGKITFFPIDGNKGPAAGGDIENGRFELDQAEGPVTGANRVEIRSVQKTGRMISPSVAVEADGPIDPNMKVEEFADVIPKAYNTYSTLKAQVSDDPAQVLRYELRSDDKGQPDDT